MRKIFFFLAIILIIASVLGFLILNIKPRETQSNKLEVAATIFPLADLIEQIGADKIKVINLLPPGASPHTFEIRPSDVLVLQNAKVIFAIGHGLDNWVANLLAKVNQGEIVPVDSGVNLQPFPNGQEDKDEPGDGVDPHYWLSPQNAKIIVANIARELSRLDPLNQDFYSANLAAYLLKLEKLDQEIKQKLAPIANAPLIVFHPSWFYFARNYNLKIVGVFEIAPGKEPTPQYLKNLYDTARENNLKNIFTEPQLNSALLEPFVKDLGLKIAVLDPLGGIGERNSYFDLIRFNANAILNAFK